MMNNIAIKKGFTLAEIMIALVMVGIISALTIPIIGSAGPNKKRIMFKKAYATAEQMVRDLINTDLYYPSQMIAPANCVIVTSGSVGDNTYRKAGTECGFAYAGITDMDIPTTANTASKKFYYLLSKKLNTVGAVNYTDTSKKLFSTTDGVDWYAAPGSGEFSLIFDVNGAEGPNSATGSGSNLQDKYTVIITYQGKMQVTGAKEIEFLSEPTKNKY